MPRMLCNKPLCFAPALPTDQHRDGFFDVVKILDKNVRRFDVTFGVNKAWNETSTKWSHLVRQKIQRFRGWKTIGRTDGFLPGFDSLGFHQTSLVDQRRVLKVLLCHQIVTINPGNLLQAKPAKFGKLLFLFVRIQERKFSANNF